MSNYDALLSELEKQLSGLEGQMAEMNKAKAKAKADDEDCADDDAMKSRKNVRKRFDREEFRKKMLKAKSKADDENDDSSYDADQDWSDDDEDDDMDKSEAKKADTKKAAPKEDEVKKDAPKEDVAKGVDETLVVEGQTISKHAVGDAQFAIFKSMSDKIAKGQEDIQKERDLRENAEFAKRADDLFKHVPGTVHERADMLKAIAKMDEPLRKSFETVLTQSEKLAKTAFETLGTGGGKNEVGGADFEKAVSEIRKRDNCTRAEAMQKARTENPDAFKAYQGN